MRGYWNDPDATRAVLDEASWMHTGDLAVMRDDGYANIVGRLKDMIIRGGENISPREIEEFLYSHPKVSDVQVIGVPDIKFGEAVCAWIRLRDGQTATEDEIREFCAGQIATFKIPRYVRFTNEFPMTVTGKIQKSRMREISVTELDSPLRVMLKPHELPRLNTELQKNRAASAWVRLPPMGRWGSIRLDQSGKTRGLVRTRPGRPLDASVHAPGRQVRGLRFLRRARQLCAAARADDGAALHDPELTVTVTL